MLNAITNPKHQRFADEYLIDFNGTQAAIRAGYRQSAAVVQASRILARDNVKQYIKEKSQSVAGKLGISASYVLSGVKKIADTTTPVGEYHNPNAANKSYELLGKHLKLFEDDDKKTPTQVTIQVVNF